ncbi:MAG: cytochrome c [Pseudomonadota bacterium]
MTRQKRPFLVVALAGLAACSRAEPGPSDTGDHAGPKAGTPITRVSMIQPPSVVMDAILEMDARRGRALFVEKSCVVCHEVNGVGGTIAPSLSAPEGGRAVDPLDFSAQIWKGASAMTALQKTELGYQIELSAQEIADLAAFAADPSEQKHLKADHLPAGLEEWVLNAEAWSESAQEAENGDSSEFDQP